MSLHQSLADKMAILFCLTILAEPNLAIGYQDDHSSAADNESRETTIALFELEVGEGVDIEAEALTDRISMQLAAIPRVKIVNRQELRHVANEQRMSLSGLVDKSAAVKLGRFLSAQQVIVGRASRIGQSFYLVLKIIDVETTVQSVVSVKILVQDGVEAMLEDVQPKLATAIQNLETTAEHAQSDLISDVVRSHANILNGKVVLIAVDERHLSRPLRDPAACMAVSHRLGALGIDTIVPDKPPANWKQILMESGRYGERSIDYLLEGDGVSSYAAEIEGLISCRARVELRLIAMPGRLALATEKGIGAEVDLVEALAAKAALEEAAVEALDALLARASRIIEGGQ